MIRTWLERTNAWRRRQPWALWRAQVWSIVRIEWKRNFRSRRGVWTYVLAFAPAVIIALHALDSRSRNSVGEDTSVLAGIFQLYYVRLGLFFGTLGIFTRLIRGKMIERSLHYYLLAPVRREVLVVGQFFAGALSALVLFEAGAFLSFAMMYGGFGAAGREYVFQGPGLSHLGAYLLIIALGCLGYGAVFLLFSMTFRNPIVPAMLVMAWEAINPVLPTLLQRISVASYLRHLMPVQVRADGALALLTVITEPVRPVAAVLGVLCLTVVLVAACCYRIRRLEISYTTD